MSNNEYEWKEDYDSSKLSDLEALNLPPNYVQLTIEQKDALDRVFYRYHNRQKDELKESYEVIIHNLKSAIREIEDSIYDLENR